MPNKHISLAERFSSHYHKGSPLECWTWLASRTCNGYGQMCVSHLDRLDNYVTPKGKRCRPYYAQVIAWYLACGYIPPNGYKVAQTCGNKLCVNPGHLLLQRSDGRRPKNKKQRKPLTGSEKLAIKQLYGSGKYTQAEIAAIFNTFQPCVSEIVNSEE